MSRTARTCVLCCLEKVDTKFYPSHLAVIVLPIILFSFYLGFSDGLEEHWSSTCARHSPALADECTQHTFSTSETQTATIDALDPMKHLFDVPTDIYYSPAGPRPEQVILLTATDGMGNSTLLQSAIENRKEYCDHHGYVFQYVDIAKYNLTGAHSHPVSNHGVLDDRSN